MTMLAYQGKKGCHDVRCRQNIADYPGYCMGYHCPRCDEPCSSQGHKCSVPFDEAFSTPPSAALEGTDQASLREQLEERDRMLGSLLARLPIELLGDEEREHIRAALDRVRHGGN